MTRLAITSTIVGAAMIVGRLPGVVASARFTVQAQKFSRSVLWGRILMGICAVWAGIIVYNAATDDWAWARPLIVIGVPIAYWLVVQYADQFLALRGLAALPQNQREVIVLKIWHKHTFEEIGELLEISPNTAAGRYRYGLQKLRLFLKGPSYERDERVERVGEAIALVDAAPPLGEA